MMEFLDWLLLTIKYVSFAFWVLVIGTMVGFQIAVAIDNFKNKE